MRNFKRTLRSQLVGMKLRAFNINILYKHKRGKRTTKQLDLYMHVITHPRTSTLEAKQHLKLHNKLIYSCMQRCTQFLLHIHHFKQEWQEQYNNQTMHHTLLIPWVFPSTTYLIQVLLELEQAKLCRNLHPKPSPSSTQASVVAALQFQGGFFKMAAKRVEILYRGLARWRAMEKFFRENESNELETKGEIEGI